MAIVDTAAGLRIAKDQISWVYARCCELEEVEAIAADLDALEQQCGDFDEIAELRLRNDVVRRRVLTQLAAWLWPSTVH